MPEMTRPANLLALAIGLLSTSALSARAAAPVPTNLPGVTTVLEVPGSLDPLTARPDQLDGAGFPPRPDAIKAPHAFASWKRAVTSGARRVMPTLTQTAITNRPNIAGLKNGTSSNWSGYVVVNGNVTSYGSTSFYYNVVDYVVPVAEQVFGACTGGWDYSSTWAGIDGYDTSDVMQAGSEADAYCGGNSDSAYYSFWYEWYPNAEVRISSLSIVPGDDVYVEVWTTSSTVGHVYLVNYTANQAVDLTFDAPSGTNLVGNSAEWVVERPGVGDGLATLTNYVEDFATTAATASFSGDISRPGAPYAGVSSLNLTMLDNSGNPISYVDVMGTSGLYFYDAGSAR